MGKGVCLATGRPTLVCNALAGGQCGNCDSNLFVSLRASETLGVWWSTGEADETNGALHPLAKVIDSIAATGRDGDYFRRMARRKPRPIDYAVDPAAWPGGRLVSGAPREAEVARHIAATLEARRGGRSYRALATASGLHHQTVVNVAGGQVWAEVTTLARLEDELGVTLWPPHG